MNKITITLLALLSCLCYACTDDEPVQQQIYGYAQFNVVKQADSRAAGDMLENLAKAEKVRVVLVHEGTALTQTLTLRRYDDESAEFGLQSDKLKLLIGEYTLTGFYLYDGMDNEIYASDGGDDPTFTIEGGAMHYHTLGVNSVLKGRATFRLTKNFVTRAEEGEAYTFSSIRTVSFTVTNMFTHQSYNIDKVRVKIKSDSESDDNGKSKDITYGECDTLVWLPTGTYQVTGYTTYSDNKSKYVLEATTVSDAPTFVVKTNDLTEHAKVPIRLSKTAEYIKDYIALKAIWEALDGPHWRYFGESATQDANWNFDKELDLWGNQPGVSLDQDGRVSTLSLLGFGIRGVVPDEIGQLTAMRVLYLGAHNETLGAITGDDMSIFDKKAQRESYEQMFLDGDVRSHFSEPMREYIDKDPKNTRPIRYSRINPKTVQTGYMTNQLQGISKALARCTELQQLYIANSPIENDKFFRDIEGEPAGTAADWSSLKNLTDIEIYNCPKLTALPMDMIAALPELQSLNVACNPNISGAQLKADWEALINGPAGEKVQGLYMGYDNLEETPSHEMLKRMKKLGALDLSHNQLHTVHPFGKEVNLVKLYLNNNKITRIYPADDGYFSDFFDVETMNFAFNQLTEVPDIFNAKSVYTIESVDFSHNNITKLQNGAAFKGINTTSIDLSYNPLAEFPKELFSTGSPIQSLIMTGCGLTEIPKGSLKGPKSYYLRSVDLSLNSLNKLPTDFYAETVPYLYGIDLSGNQFEEIPRQPLDCYTLTVMVLRNQRDEAGNRTLRYWLQGIYQHPQLTALYLGGNDLRKIEDTISPYIRVFEIKDNPNISIDLSSVCSYIQSGYYMLFYDRTQDIRGCAILDLDN